MSVCSNLRLSGLRVQRTVDADTLTFRGETIAAVLNRPTVGGPDFQEAALNQLGGSTIEILKEDLAELTDDSAPKLGQIFTETGGTTHRIIRIEASPLTWKLTCEPTDP
jgi:hypothetical protein